VTVLVVEDSRIQAQILSKKLEDSGYKVILAENGALALTCIGRQRPTLIISDVEMPEMTGYELCRAVKNDPQLRSIPFILLSTLSEPQDIIKGLHCGADNYVTKPYDPDFLISRMESLLTTPVGTADDSQQLDVTLAGERYSVNAGRQQVLNLLVSTFENAVQKNNELIHTNQELTLAKEQLTVWNEKLEDLNGRLEAANNRMTRDLNAAAKVQQSLLPDVTPKTQRAQFSWKYLPCDELAGDFLNVFPLDDTHIAAFVVDVSGHGVASSLLAVTIGRLLTPQVSSSSLLVQKGANGDDHRIVPPLEVVQELNRRFPMEEQNGLYFTMTYGILDTQTMEFRHAEAGHPQIARVPAGTGTPELIEGGGMAIGWIPDIDCTENVVQLAKGDRLFLYSDGVPEAMDPDLNQFGNRQMLELLELGRTQPLDYNVSLLLEGVQRWGGNGTCLKDDVSILGLEVSDSGTPA
jgi:sigma-B regulation protein RsbU (phosphoserine phosphatase)